MGSLPSSSRFVVDKDALPAPLSVGQLADLLDHAGQSAAELHKAEEARSLASGAASRPRSFVGDEPLSGTSADRRAEPRRRAGSVDADDASKPSGGGGRHSRRATRYPTGGGAFSWTARRQPKAQEFCAKC